MVWLEVPFPDGVGVGEFVGEVFKFGVKSLVRTYRIRILNSISAWVWVCHRMGLLPWYMMGRLTSSMCMPHVQPSAWEGVLLMVTLGVIDRVIGGAIGIPEYRRRMELCMRPMTLGGCNFSES